MKQENFLKISQESKDLFIKKLSLFAEIVAKTKSADAADTGSFRMIISTESLDRQGDTLSLDNFDLENYMKNPVVLWGHDYYNLPIGITDKISIENGQMIAEGRFAPTEEAQEIRKYYDAKFPLGNSVGYMPSEYDEKTGEVAKYELLEWSMVSVPANQDCVPLHQARSLKLDIAFLTAKGLKFAEVAKKKDAEAGSPCEMDDGTPGVFAERDGSLVCVPEKSKAQEGEGGDITNPEKDKLDEQLMENMKSMHEEHAKNIKEIAMKCQKAIEEFGEGEKAAKDIEEFKSKAIEEFKAMHKTMDGEHALHQQKCMKAIEEYTKSIDEFTKGEAGDEKSLQKLYVNLKSIVDKSTNGYEAISIAYIKELLTGVGAAAKDEKAAKGLTPKEIAENKSFDDLVKLRSILRDKATEISETLTSINTAIKEQAKK